MLHSYILQLNIVTKFTLNKSVQIIFFILKMGSLNLIISF